MQALTYPLESYSSDYKKIISNYRLWRSLNARQTALRIYFDAADLIDILHGMGSLHRGQALSERYRSLSTMVYALAYRNWLGQIAVLPPHLAEFADKMQTSYSSQLFPNDFRSAQYNEWEKEFWGYTQPGTTWLFKDKAYTQEELKALVRSTPDLFLGVYLLQHRAFWKDRYRYLRKEKILAFDTESYPVAELQRRPLFRLLEASLNKNRSTTTSNNYVDALALCILDQLLEEHLADPTVKALPILYSNQPRLLKTINEVSRKKVDGRYPLRLPAEEGDALGELVVRNSHFFFWSGILRGMEQHDQDLFQRFINSLDELQQESALLELHQPYSALQQKWQSNAREKNHQFILVEFFKLWWDKGGIQEVRQKLDYDSLSPEQEAQHNQQVDGYIQEERKRFEKEFLLPIKANGFIRKAWKTFDDLDKEILEQWVRPEIKINAHHEFGPRFAVEGEVCEQIQVLFDELLRTVGQQEAPRLPGEETERIRQEITELKSDLVTRVIDGLTTHISDAETRQKKVNEIATATAVFWLLGKYNLVDEVCNLLRHAPTLKRATEDPYPHAAFAIIHLAAQLYENRELRHNETLNTLQKIEKKYTHDKPNYNVWLGLSYIYYRLAEREGEIFTIPEDFAEEDMPYRQETAMHRYLQKTQYYAELTRNYLHEELKHDTHRRQRHQRAYYSSLNNILFCKTRLAEPAELYPLERSIADRIKAVNHLQPIFHESRYNDTLARFYYRLARIADGNPLYHAHQQNWIREAKKFNQLSLASKLVPQQKIYANLESMISRLEADKQSPHPSLFPG